jgi:hypothetical protein
MSHVSDPALYAAAVTPSDATILTPTRALYIGTSGDLTVEQRNGVITYSNVPVGIFPIEVTRVLAATTAGNICAMW